MAVSDPTTNYGWLLPDVGADTGAWGTMLREVFGAATGDLIPGMDSVINAVSVIANASMPKAGGVFSGEIEVLTDRYIAVASGNLTGAVTFDMAAARFFHGTVTGTITSVTFDSSSITSGDAVFIVMELTNGGAFSIGWGSTFQWPGGTAPTLTETGTDVLSFYTIDGGTIWRGALAQEASF